MLEAETFEDLKLSEVINGIVASRVVKRKINMKGILISAFHLKYSHNCYVKQCYISFGVPLSIF